MDGLLHYIHLCIMCYTYSTPLPTPTPKIARHLKEWRPLSRISTHGCTDHCKWMASYITYIYASSSTPTQLPCPPLHPRLPGISKNGDLCPGFPPTVVQITGY